MRLLVTRPEPDGEAHGGETSGAGLRGHAGAASASRAHRRRPRRRLARGCDHQRQCLCAPSPSADLSSLLMLPVFAVGGRTAEAARGAGLRRCRCRRTATWRPCRVIKTHRGLVRASSPRGRGPLRRSRGRTRRRRRSMCRPCVVYRRRDGRRSRAMFGTALVAGWIDSALHFSRRSAETYLTCAAAAGILPRRSRPCTICLSRQVAEPLAAAGAPDPGGGAAERGGLARSGQGSLRPFGSPSIC